jgi:hypothetical protein
MNELWLNIVVEYISVYVRWYVCMYVCKQAEQRGAGLVLQTMMYMLSLTHSLSLSVSLHPHPHPHPHPQHYGPNVCAPSRRRAPKLSAIPSSSYIYIYIYISPEEPGSEGPPAPPGQRGPWSGVPDRRTRACPQGFRPWSHQWRA